jgi:hypothetical protein
VSENALYRARIRGDGVPFVIIGECSARYPLAAVLAWETEQLDRSMAEHLAVDARRAEALATSRANVAKARKTRHPHKSKSEEAAA